MLASEAEYTPRKHQWESVEQMEHAVIILKGQIRNLETATEDHCGCKLDPKGTVLASIPREREAVDPLSIALGRTGRIWETPSSIFGERILVKVASTRR